MILKLLLSSVSLRGRWRITRMGSSSIQQCSKQVKHSKLRCPIGIIMTYIQGTSSNKSITVTLNKLIRTWLWIRRLNTFPVPLSNSWWFLIRGLTRHLHSTSITIIKSKITTLGATLLTMTTIIIYQMANECHQLWAYRIVDPMERTWEEIRTLEWIRMLRVGHLKGLRFKLSLINLHLNDSIYNY